MLAVALTAFTLCWEEATIHIHLVGTPRPCQALCSSLVLPFSASAHSSEWAGIPTCDPPLLRFLAGSPCTSSSVFPPLGLSALTWAWQVSQESQQPLALLPALYTVLPLWPLRKGLPLTSRSTSSTSSHHPQESYVPQLSCFSWNSKRLNLPLLPRSTLWHYSIWKETLKRHDVLAKKHLSSS